MFKIGIMSDSLKLPVLESILKARELGVDGVQCYTVQGEMAPDNLDAPARDSIRKFCHENGIIISALCGDLGGHGFRIAGENPEKIRRTRAIVDLAADLGTAVVTTHIGVVPENRNSLTYEIMVEACRKMGAYAAGCGVTLAIETGPEPPERLLTFLQDTNTKGLGVNYDPANLVMVQGIDPVPGVRLLSGYIVHTHAKDGVNIKPCEAVKVYDSFAVGGIDGFNFGEYFNEVPLGEGRVPWDDYLTTLASCGYDGFLTIEREVGANPVKDITLAVEFLKKRLSHLRTVQHRSKK
jgi:sugar phosphate isomerase/epimerase